ncbi:MAG: DUF6884 domain-containing protein [Patescibacteria group bacterium]
MKIVCTICSRVKSEESVVLPAQERYLAPHIAQAKVFAEMLELPYYILSGKFGLVRADEPVPYYDHRLKEDEIDRVAGWVMSRIAQDKITHINFCAEQKPTWAPYEEILRRACERTGVILTLHLI